MVLFLKVPTLRRVEVLQTLRDPLVLCYWLLRMHKLWSKPAVTFSLFLILCAPGPIFLSHWPWWLYADPGLDNFQILIKNKSSKSKSSVWGPQFIPVTMLWGHFCYYFHFLYTETKAQAVKKWTQSKMLVSTRTRKFSFKADHHKYCCTLRPW